MSSQLENLNHSLNNTVPQIIRKADDAELSQHYPYLGQPTRVTYDGLPWVARPKQSGEKWLSFQISAFAWGEFKKETILQAVHTLEGEHVITWFGSFGTSWPKPSSLGTSYLIVKGVTLLYFRNEDADTAKHIAAELSTYLSQPVQVVFEDVGKMNKDILERMIVDQTNLDFFVTISPS